VIRRAGAIEAAAQQRRLFQDADIGAGDAAIADQVRRAGERGNAATDQIGLGFFSRCGSIGINHDDAFFDLVLFGPETVRGRVFRCLSRLISTIAPDARLGLDLDQSRSMAGRTGATAIDVGARRGHVTAMVRL
jgi:hypothetical protein